MSKKKSKLEVHQPDDRFFKRVMKKVENARAYLKNFYANIAALLDLDTLKLEETSFLTKEFKSFDADIIYSCAFKDSEEEFYCCFLWENKSIADDSVVLQVGVYQLIALYQMQTDKKSKLRPIIPLVFYNGKQDWQPKTVKELFQKHPHYERFQAWLPTIPFHFLNISKRPIDELLSIEERSFRSTMLSMASRFKQHQLLDYAAEIFDVEDKQYLEMLVSYYFGVLERSPKSVKERFKAIEFTTKKNVMSTLEQMIEEGRVEGRMEGEVNAKIEERMSKVISFFNLLKHLPTATAKDISVISLLSVEQVELIIVANDLESVKLAVTATFFEGLPFNEAQKEELQTIIIEHLPQMN